MSYRRREIGPPPGDLTDNERACLLELQQAGEGIALSTTQVASRTKLHTSSALVALTRLVARGLIGRTSTLNRPVNEPVRWFLIDASAAA